MTAYFHLPAAHIRTVPTHDVYCHIIKTPRVETINSNIRTGIVNCPPSGRRARTRSSTEDGKQADGSPSPISKLMWNLSTTGGAGIASRRKLLLPSAGRHWFPPSPAEGAGEGAHGLASRRWPACTRRWGRKPRCYRGLERPRPRHGLGALLLRRQPAVAPCHSSAAGSTLLTQKTDD